MDGGERVGSPLGAALWMVIVAVLAGAAAFGVIWLGAYVAHLVLRVALAGWGAGG